MRWTTEAPKVSGWYWRRQAYEGTPMDSCEWEMVRVESRGGVLEACEPMTLTDEGAFWQSYRTHDWERVDPEAFIQYAWAGPIPEPEGGDDAE